ncbi:MAG: chemotaxis protein CheY [Myxococcaceae bacterium]|nr:chemotaxis protein CheY [Myxococcaceae bacterium]
MDIPRRRPAVLIVDDDFDIRELMADLIHDDGFEVFSAKNGREALAELRTRPVKVIILDLHMPTMDGHTFRKEQLADPALSSIPIVLLSGHDDYAAIALLLGAIAALKKPFLPDALLGVLQPYR